MEWTANSDELIIQRMNRLQNTNQVMLCDVVTGAARTMFTDQDEAWVEVCDDLRWLSDGSEFTFLSERDGYQQLYAVPRDGGQPRKITTGNYDVIQVVTIDEPGGWVYFIASPDHLSLPETRTVHPLLLAWRRRWCPRVRALHPRAGATYTVMGSSHLGDHSSGNRYARMTSPFWSALAAPGCVAPPRRISNTRSSSRLARNDDCSPKMGSYSGMDLYPRSPPMTRCTRCDRDVPGYEGVHRSDGKGGDLGFVCGRCWAHILSEHSGEPVAHLEVEPIILPDVGNTPHEFHFRYNPAPRGLEAFELRDGSPGGYHFAIMAEHEESNPSLAGRLLAKIRRGLAYRHLEPSELIPDGLHIVGEIVRGRIDWDDEQEDRVPQVVIDGVPISWTQFGQMLMTFEGSQFRLDLLDRTEEA